MNDVRGLPPAAVDMGAPARVEDAGELGEPAPGSQEAFDDALADSANLHDTQAPETRQAIKRSLDRLQEREDSGSAPRGVKQVHSPGVAPRGAEPGRVGKSASAGAAMGTVPKEPANAQQAVPANTGNEVPAGTDADWRQGALGNDTDPAPADARRAMPGAVSSHEPPGRVAPQSRDAPEPPADARVRGRSRQAPEKAPDSLSASARGAVRTAPAAASGRARPDAIEPAVSEKAPEAQAAPGSGDEQLPSMGVTHAADARGLRPEIAGGQVAAQSDPERMAAAHLSRQPEGTPPRSPADANTPRARLGSDAPARSPSGPESTPPARLTPESEGGPRPARRGGDGPVRTPETAETERSDEANITADVPTDLTGMAASSSVPEAGPSAVPETVQAPAGRVAELAGQVAERILVSVPEPGARDEVRISLKESVLDGSDVRIFREGGELRIVFVAQTEAAGQFLADNRMTLQQTLGERLQDERVRIEVETPGREGADQQDNEGRSRQRYVPQDDSSAPG